jgi:hypothetical protein
MGPLLQHLKDYLAGDIVRIIPDQGQGQREVVLQPELKEIARQQVPLQCRDMISQVADAFRIYFGRVEGRHILAGQQGAGENTRTWAYFEHTGAARYGQGGGYPASYAVAAQEMLAQVFFGFYH